MRRQFGNLIKTLRKQRNFTQQELCVDERQLSVRHLRRIENGEYYPKFTVIVYLAQRLGVSVSRLTEGYSHSVPEDYRKLKETLIRLNANQSPEKQALKKEILQTINREYMGNLPEDEKEIIRYLRTMLDLHSGVPTVEGISDLSAKLEQLTDKSTLTTNDLLTLQFYLFSVKNIVGRGVEYTVSAEYRRIVEQIIKFLSGDQHTDLYQVRDILIMIASIELLCSHSVDRYLELLEDYQITYDDYQRKATVDMLQWKNGLLKGELARATRYYEAAINYSKNILDTYTVENLKKEWQSDLEFHSCDESH